MTTFPNPVTNFDRALSAAIVGVGHAIAALNYYSANHPGPTKWDMSSVAKQLGGCLEGLYSVRAKTNILTDETGNSTMSV